MKKIFGPEGPEGPEDLWVLIKKYKIASVTAGGGQHHDPSVCFLCCDVSWLNNEIRRKQKPEFDKTSCVGPLNLWICRTKWLCKKQGRQCNSVENEVTLIEMASFLEPDYLKQCKYSP